MTFWLLDTAPRPIKFTRKLDRHESNISYAALASILAHSGTPIYGVSRGFSLIDLYVKNDSLIAIEFDPLTKYYKDYTYIGVAHKGEIEFISSRIKLL